MPPNMTADKQDDFIEKLTDSVTQAQTFSPTAIIIIGDFNAGNIFSRHANTRTEDCNSI